MSFSINPSTAPMPPVTPQEFPQFLQIRVNGVDLGGPDVTVIDFVGDNWTVTRGDGDDANVLTVAISSGS